jgi:hypothetical protein
MLPLGAAFAGLRSAPAEEVREDRFDRLPLEEAPP